MGNGKLVYGCPVDISILLDKFKILPKDTLESIKDKIKDKVNLDNKKDFDSFWQISDTDSSTNSSDSTDSPDPTDSPDSTDLVYSANLIDPVISYKDPTESVNPVDSTNLVNPTNLIDTITSNKDPTILVDSNINSTDSDNSIESDISSYKNIYNSEF